MKRVPILYLTSYALSLLGNSIAGIALPLLVLQTTGSLASTGILAATTAIPAFLAGIFLGVVIDRVNRRTSSVTADLISAASIAALPVVDLVTGLDLGWFILFGIIGAVGDVPGLTAREAMLPAIIRHGTIGAERMVGLRESIGAVMIVIGPAAAGALMLAFEGSTVLWITAATSLAAALVTLAIPSRVGSIPATEQPTAQTSSLRELADGWRVLFRSNRLLRAVTLINLALITVVASLQGLVLPAHFTLVDEPGLFGFVLTSLAVGTLVGGGIYAVFGKRGSRRRWFVPGMVGTVLGITTVAILPTEWLIFAGAFVLGLSLGLFSSLLGLLMLETIPDAMRGRIMGTQNSLMMIAAPLGIVLVSFIGDAVDLSAAALTLAALWAVTTVVALFAPVLRSLEPARIPQPEEVVSEKQ